MEIDPPLTLRISCRNAQLVAAVEHLAGKGLVELPKPDIVHGKTGAFQKTRHGKDRSDAHLIRLATGNDKTAKSAHWLQVALLGFRCLDQHAGRRAVRQAARHCRP